MNGDGTAGQAGRSGAATALPQGSPVYHEVADLTAADFKALGRGFQVLHLASLCCEGFPQKIMFYLPTLPGLVLVCQLVSSCVYRAGQTVVNEMVESDGVECFCRVS